MAGTTIPTPSIGSIELTGIVSDEILPSHEREGIIVPLDRHFVVYPGTPGAGVDEAAGIDKGEEECPGVVCPSSCDVLTWPPG